MSYHAVHLAACAGCPFEIVRNDAVGFWQHTDDHGFARHTDHDAAPVMLAGRTVGHATGQREPFPFDADGFRIGRFDADGSNTAKDYTDEFSRYE